MRREIILEFINNKKKKKKMKRYTDWPWKIRINSPEKKKKTRLEK